VKIGLVLALGLLLFSAAEEASSQRTGSRIGRNAQAGNVEDAELALSMMAQCVAARRPAMVRSWLATLPGSEEERRFLHAQTEDLSLCMESNKLVLDGMALAFKPRTLRRPVALAMVERRLPQVPVQAPAAPGTEPWFVPRLANITAATPLDRGSLVLQDFGHCVALRAWQDVRSLFAAKLESAEEAVAVRRLTPALGPCLSEGVTINITRKNMRLILAEPFYHLSTSSPPRARTRK
jgi:hypothetical protein